MRSIIVTEEVLASIFTEWQARYIADPDGYLDSIGDDPDGYGPGCAAYLIELGEELDKDRADVLFLSLDRP